MGLTNETLETIRRRRSARAYQQRQVADEEVRAAERIISLPLFPDMSNEDVQYVCKAIREILRHPPSNRTPKPASGSGMRSGS